MRIGKIHIFMLCFLMISSGCSQHKTNISNKEKNEIASKVPNHNQIKDGIDISAEEISSIDIEMMQWDDCERHTVSIKNSKQINELITLFQDKPINNDNKLFGQRELIIFNMNYTNAEPEKYEIVIKGREYLLFDEKKTKYWTYGKKSYLNMVNIISKFDNIKKESFFSELFKEIKSGPIFEQKEGWINLLKTKAAGFNGLDFDNNQQKYESIIKEIQNIKFTGIKRFKVDLNVPSKLQEIPLDSFPERGEGAGHICAEITNQGKLKVLIETMDLGHAGESGYVYSEEKLEPTDKWHKIDVPGRHISYVTRQLTDKWWIVYCNEE